MVENFGEDLGSILNKIYPLDSEESTFNSSVKILIVKV